SVARGGPRGDAPKVITKKIPPALDPLDLGIDQVSVFPRIAHEDEGPSTRLGMRKELTGRRHASSLQENSRMKSIRNRETVALTPGAGSSSPIHGASGCSLPGPAFHAG